MSEAYGTILIKGPEAITKGLLDDDEGPSWEAMEALFAAAGIDDMANSHSMLGFQKGNNFHNEGLSEKDGFAVITIFGDEWMHAMEALVTKGKDVEVYGSIFHEHGVMGYYTLDHEGKSHFSQCDIEGDDEEVDEDAIKLKWLESVPENIKKAFPNAFSDEEDEEDD